MKYPRIRLTFTITPSGLCAICNQPDADARIIVQFDLFRYNDKEYKVHLGCIKDKEDDQVLREVGAKNG